jgi:hypothetical protein
MAYNNDYGSDFSALRPSASRRTRGYDIRSRGFGNDEQKRSSVEPMRHSHYDNYGAKSSKINRSTSGSREYAYKLDQIHNRLAEKNNPLLSFYKEKAQARIKTAERNYDSSYLKNNFQNYGRGELNSKRSIIKSEGEEVPDSQRSQISKIKSRQSTRGQITYSRALRNSGENLMQTSANKKMNQKHLDVIYEDPYNQADQLDPKQKEILEKYYLQSRRNLRPSQRVMRTPMLTPDNNIKFVDNGSMIKNPKPTKTPPPPMWGEESEIDETAGEPFYDPENDPARNSKTLLHLDSSRSRRQNFIKEKLSENNIDNNEPETVIIHDKRPKGSKLKKKIVYVYDSESDEEENGGKLKLPSSKRADLMPYGIKSSNHNKSYIGSNRSYYDDMAYSKKVSNHNRSSYIPKANMSQERING